MILPGGSKTMRQAGERAGGLPASWRVELPMFEGPLDLLLHLVRLNRVEITEISVNTICDQFHEYLDLMEELDLDIAAEYLYEASLLVHLKSKLLLPRYEEAEAADDPRQDLVQRLREYQRMKEAARSLGETHRHRLGIMARGDREIRALRAEDADEVDMGEVSLYDLLSAFHKVLKRFEMEHPQPFSVAGERYSVRDQVRRFLETLPPRGRGRLLTDELALLANRSEAIAAFLAVLEMLRLRLLRLLAGEGGAVLIQRTRREFSAEELEAVAP
jgi:segregation and condensation protein A